MVGFLKPNITKQIPVICKPFLHDVKALLRQCEGGHG